MGTPMTVNFYAAVFDGNAYGPCGNSDDDWGINVSNSNASDLLANLRLLDGDLFEMPPIPAIKFRTRANIFLQSVLGRPDPALPTTVDAAPGRATFVDCGRREGYLQERVRQILAHLEERAHATHIVFG